MRIVTSLNGVEESIPCSLALGTFDGVHLGHRAVIENALSSSGEPLESGVFTFRQSPLGAPRLLTHEDKLSLFERMGVGRVYALDFAQVRELEPEDFVERILFRRCKVRRICCGEDFRFGKGARGNAALLERLCSQLGIRLNIAPPVMESGEKISSTRIRAAVENGDMPLAKRLLGRPFGFTLPVIHGNHLGAGMGTPTANQALPEGFVRPRFGVYASWTLIDGKRVWGVTDVGVKPTVGSDKILAETWFPRFSGNLYGVPLTLRLEAFVRPERKFSSLEELKAEILKNAEEARAILEKEEP